ncbi:neuronal acetylcholine receptor subunit alpha-5-like [Dendronephthya gigantea]|uniref:neuronal acetylcholine receptor subunit alpha-5-like n=1 Tax=Dendronephthya gigantea TaxID=151771 RepID=UPI00106CA9D7|nr:neuronal acetylcholine receptor subunit alpha-5-like [Dendronephthya gigantea]
MSPYNFGRVLFLRVYVLCFCLPLRQVSGSNDTVGNHFEEHQRLLELLMNNSNVNRQILPASHNNKPVNVEMGIKLRQIANVDEKNQVMRLILWLTFHWLNPHLKWNPAEYGGINSVHVDHDLFWFPDVAVFNEAGFESENVILHHRLRTKMVITKDGYCTWQAPVTLNSYCTLDLTDFPFDEQECPVQIGSWTHPGEEINMTYSDRNADLSHYIRSGEWILQSATLSQDFGYYKPEISPHPHITLSLKIERRQDYYKYQIIIPLALITILVTYSFILPLNIQDQISIVLTIVVSISVYSVIISSALPKTADPIPALLKFSFQMLILTVVSSIHIFLTSPLVTKISNFPKWLFKIESEDDSENAHPKVATCVRIFSFLIFLSIFISFLVCLLEKKRCAY